jgi:hypothetical protein
MTSRFSTPENVQDVDELNAILLEQGFNLQVQSDPYNDHCYSVSCSLGNCDVDLAQTKCDDLDLVGEFIARKQEDLASWAEG